MIRTTARRCYHVRLVGIRLDKACLVDCLWRVWWVLVLFFLRFGVRLFLRFGVRLLLGETQVKCRSAATIVLGLSCAFAGGGSGNPLPP